MTTQSNTKKMLLAAVALATLGFSTQVYAGNPYKQKPPTTTLSVQFGGVCYQIAPGFPQSWVPVPSWARYSCIVETRIPSTGEYATKQISFAGDNIVKSPQRLCDAFAVTAASLQIANLPKSELGAPRSVIQFLGGQTILYRPANTPSGIIEISNHCKEYKF